MIRRLASMVALLALVAAPAAALGGVAAPARPGEAEPRAALLKMAAEAGAIVEVSGRSIVVTRRDGSETRLKGRLPGDPQAAEGDGRPLIQDGEVWVRAEEGRRLVGLGGDAAGPEGSGGPPDEAGFETFVVPKPTIIEPEAREEAVGRSLVLPEVTPEAAEGGASAYAAPVEVDLSMARLTSFSDPHLRGIYYETIGPGRADWEMLDRRLGSPSATNRLLSHMSMEVDDEWASYRIGDGFDPIMGVSTGIEMSRAVSENASVGTSVRVPRSRFGERQEGQVAVGAEMEATRGLSGKAEIASAGSYYGLARWERKSLSLRSSLLESSTGGSGESWWQYRARPGVTLFGGSSAIRGEHETRATLSGARWRVSQLHMGIERMEATAGEGRWATDAMSLSLLRPGFSGILRYLVAREGEGREGLEWSLSRIGRSGSQTFWSSSAPRQGESEEGRSYRVGVRRPVGRGVLGQAGLEWGPAGVHPEGKLEWRLSRDEVVSVRWGRVSVGELEAEPQWGLVVQAQLGFGGSRDGRRGMGRIGGEVADDAGQRVADVVVLLDGEAAARTGRDGRYEFAAVTEGKHVVEIDPARLHADLGGDLRPRTVVVTAGGTRTLNFLVTRLCGISGRVYVQSGESAGAEALAGVVVELSTGERVMTDPHGRYTFGGLAPGRYTVSVALDGGPSDLRALPPDSWSLNLHPGERAEGADFGFARKGRPLVFGMVSER